MPDISDSDARVLALRMYYIELAEGVSNSNAQQKVGKMFLISSRTVKRWVDPWEMTEEEAITDQRSVTMHNEDHSILFLCPNLVFELRSWIRKRLKLGGKHKDGYLTTQQVQNTILLGGAGDCQSYPMNTLAQFGSHCRPCKLLIGVF